ncbi:AMP-binding protein [Kitasatospora sp. NPDC006697]|uniref:AMP-binding protein n=1 Tax=Kitasatospora sp. NPDC006697 TaxID=3364020 RepID=UPI0036AC9F1B
MIDLLRIGEHGPDSRALLVDGHPITRQELARLADSVAAALASGRKAVVWLAGDRDLSTVLGYLGGVRAGHAVAFLPCGQDRARAEAILDTYRPEFVVPTPWLAGVLAERGYAPRDTGTACELFARRAGGPADTSEEVAPELLVLLSTSGSTGSAKAAKLSAEAVAASTAAITESLAVGPGDLAATSLPVRFSYGLSVLNTHLWAGAAVLLTAQNPTALRHWQELIAARVTAFSAVPTTYRALGPAHQRLFAESAVRTMTTSGGRLDPAVQEHWWRLLERRGGAFHPMYGQTESTARITCMPAGALPERFGSVGTAVPGGRVWTDPALPEGAAAPGEGEICFSGPGVMSGYALGRADLVRCGPPQPVLRTGDLGRLDGGFLYVTGRLKRIAKIFGYRANLDEVEGRLDQSGGELAVTATDERVTVFVTDAAGEDWAQAQRRGAVEALGLPDACVLLRRIGALPRTPNGKTDYAALAAAGPAAVGAGSGAAR